MSQMRCIYEVKVEVDESIAEEYLLWLKTHIADIVAQAGFTKAELFTLTETPPNTRSWVTHYHSKSREQVDSYMKNLAPHFRADGINRFGNRFRAERRILIFQS